MKIRWAIVTGEYPPQPGGVSDYTRQVACGLARAGDDVHVWAPKLDHHRTQKPDPDIAIHRLPDHFGFAGLRKLRLDLRAIQPDRLLVQYVPHAFGMRAMNLPFCLALRRAGRQNLWTFFHEVAFPFVRRPIHHNLLAIAHRAMAQIMVGGSRRIFVSTSAWQDRLHTRDATWLPIPSNLPADVDPAASATLRAAWGAADSFTIGYFGSYCGDILRPLLETLPRLLRTQDRIGVLLGRGGDAWATTLLQRNPWLARRIIAPGELPACEAAAHLAACDVVVLPFPDGATSRRSSLMAALALGCAIVTTCSDVTEPLLRDAAATALVPANDPDAIGRAVSDLLNDPGRRSAMAQNARQLYRRHFSLDHTIRRLREEDG